MNSNKSNKETPPSVNCLNCQICKQPIRNGELAEWVVLTEEYPRRWMHGYTEDCVAAVTRRCREIVENSPTSLIAMQRIEAEFKLAATR